MTKPLPRIASVEHIIPASLRIAWRSPALMIIEASENVNLAGWIATGGEILAPLNDPTVFATARLGDYGASVEWGNAEGDLAIDAHHLRQIADEQRAFTHVDVVAWQEAVNLSNQEAADFLDVALSTWNAYKAGTSQMPMTMAMVCRATLRDPILIQAHYRPRKAGRPRRGERAQRPL